MKGLIFVWLFLFFSLLNAQNTYKKSLCLAAINRFVNDSDLIGSSISFSLINATNGDEVASLDKDRNLIPASTLKIITCATALMTAGESYQFNTLFEFKGSILQDSIFRGNLYINGMGDPSFGSGKMIESRTVSQIADTLASLLFNECIREFQGNIIINSDYIKDIPENPEWLYYDLANYYGAGVFGFNVLENSANITLEKKLENSSYQITRVYPSEISDIFQNNLKFVEYNLTEDDDLFFLGSSQCNQLTLNGLVNSRNPNSYTLKSSIPYPALAYQLILENQLRLRGIRMVKPNSSSMNLYPYFTYNNNSPNLRSLVQYTLKNSVNLYCESFVHLIGDVWFKNTNRNNSLRSIEKFWEAKLNSENALRLVDGSGLSRKNSLNAETLCGILRSIYADNSPRNFYELLNNIKEEGVLSEILSKEKSLVGEFRLKSGSMEGVRTYAGYILYNHNPRYIISLLINGYHCNSKIVSAAIAKLLIEIDRNLKPT
ncbi:MAG: D-alanyl-D-alanine carboxypeptidase/D-alanyl-D-alanine-endopeptidase [Saprospiraceae bacterium]